MSWRKPKQAAQIVEVAEHVTQLCQHVAWPESPDKAELERVPNPHADKVYLARFTAPDLSTGNVAVSYLDAAGAPIADTATNYAAIRYVQVRIVDYTQQMLIPFIMPSFLMPSFTATLPIESLGYSPTQQAFLPCLPV